jgi:hypothetical protein
MATDGNSNQSNVECYEDFDTVVACDWSTLSLNDRQNVDDGLSTSPQLPSWTFSSTASPTCQRRFALGYSVLTEADARLACYELAAEQRWDRAKDDQSKAAFKSDVSTYMGTTSGLEVDFFPPLVSPRASKSEISTVSSVSMLTPTSPLQRRSKRLREGLEILRDGLLRTSSPPLTVVSPETPSSCTQDTPRTTREPGNCLMTNPKAVDTLKAPTL